MTQRPSVAIVVPIYNEARNLPGIIERVEEAASSCGYDHQVICVDDGSTDGSGESLKAIKGLKIVTHPRNKGYGAALLTGFAHARGYDYVAFLDADQTYPPAELSGLLEQMEQNGDALMCIGSRMVRPNEMEPLRRLGNQLYATLCKALFSSELSDVCSGMRVFRSDLFEAIDWKGFSNDLDFSPQLTSRCLCRHVPVIETPIDYHERGGQSKLKLFSHGFRFLGSILQERIRWGSPKKQ